MVEEGNRLAAATITLSYPGQEQAAVSGLSTQIPAGKFSVIVGPNACGKSTLLRAFTRILRPISGAVLLEGKAISSFAPKALAQAVAMLPQSATAPDGITVGDLVARGRFPHQGLMRQWSDADEAAVVWAMECTRIESLVDRRVSDLSGGQRQRVWIAMALAQQSATLLLDEPTTFLDLAHQLEILELCEQLVAEQDMTIVAVLHDLNQAARYAQHIIAMKAGQVVASGDPTEVVTAEMVATVFGVSSRIISDPVTGTPLVLPEKGMPG